MLDIAPSRGGGRGRGRGDTIRGGARAPLAKNKHWVADHLDKTHFTTPRRGAPDGRWERGGLRGGRGRVAHERGGVLSGAGSATSTSVFAGIGSTQVHVDLDDEDGGEATERENGGDEAMGIEEIVEPVLETQEEREKFWKELVKAREAERLKAISEGKMDDPLVPKRLEDAITMVGTCPDMCPRFERYRRERENNLFEWEVIPGTKRVDHKRAVKMYERAVGDKVIPSDLRPPAVLRRTLDYLFHELIPRSGFGPTHTFVRDRSRAVRNDFTIQYETGPTAIECLDRCARFHILALHIQRGKVDPALETQQLMQTLLSLKEFYDTNREADLNFQVASELEMRIYHRLIHIRDQVERVEHVPPHISSHPVFVLTTKFRKRVQENSAPIKKTTPLIVDASAMQIFGELVAVLRAEGNLVMIYLVACILENLFGDDTIDNIESIKGDLSIPDIIDGVSANWDTSAENGQDGGETMDDAEQYEDDAGEYDEGDYNQEAMSDGVEDGDQGDEVEPASNALAVPQPSIVFGTAPTPPVFGSSTPFSTTSSSPFAATQSTASAAPTVTHSSAFGGLTSKPNVFGTASSAFGGTSSAFGSTNKSVFGASSIFGSTSSSPFGSTSTTPAPAAAPPSTSFGPSTTPIPATGSSPFSAPAQQAGPPAPSSLFSTGFPSTSPSLPVEAPNPDPVKPSSTSFTLSTAPSIISPPPPSRTSPDLLSSVPPLNKNASPFVSSGAKPFASPPTPSVPSTASQPPPAAAATPEASSIFGTYSFTANQANGSQPSAPSAASTSSNLSQSTITFPTPPTFAPRTPSIQFGKGNTPPLSLNVSPAVVAAGRIPFSSARDSPVTPRTTMPAAPSMDPISLPPTPNPQGFDGGYSPAKLSLLNFGRRESYAQSAILSPLFPSSPSTVSMSTFPLPNASTGLNSSTGQPSPQTFTGLTGVPAPPVAPTIEQAGRENLPPRPLPIDVDAQVKAFQQRSTAVRTAFSRWYEKLTKRIAWLEACRRSENYSQRVQREKASASPSPSVNNKRLWHSTGSSPSLSRSLSDRRVRRKVSAEYKAPVTDHDLARRFAQKQEDHERRWAKGTFLRTVQSHVQAAGSGVPSGWQAWLSLNQEHDATAIWLETKFDVPASGQWAKDVFTVSISPPSPPRLLSSPGLIVFECTPLDGLPDALERKYRVLEDCGRLRDVVTSLSPSRHLAPGILFLVWADGESVELPQDLLEMVQQHIANQVLRDFKVFGVASETKNLDAILASILRSMELDLVGSRMSRLPYTGLCNILLTPWNNTTSSWIDRFSGFTDINHSLSARAMEYMVATIGVLIEGVATILGLPDLQALPPVDPTPVNDFGSLVNSFMNWIGSEEMGDDPLYYNIATDVQSHVDSTGQFPLRILPDHLSRIVLARVEAALGFHRNDKLIVPNADLEVAQRDVELTLQTCTEQLRLHSLSLPRARPLRRPRAVSDFGTDLDSMMSTPKRQRTSLSPRPEDGHQHTNGTNGIAVEDDEIMLVDELELTNSHSHHATSNQPRPPPSPSPAPSTTSTTSGKPAVSIETLRALTRSILSSRPNTPKK